MASMFKERSTVLGLPIGRKKLSWKKVGGWIVGLGVVLAGVIIGRDTIQHRGNGSQSQQSGQ